MMLQKMLKFGGMPSIHLATWRTSLNLMEPLLDLARREETRKKLLLNLRWRLLKERVRVRVKPKRKAGKGGTILILSKLKDISLLLYKLCFFLELKQMLYLYL